MIGRFQIILAVVMVNGLCPSCCIIHKSFDSANSSRIYTRNSRQPIPRPPADYSGNWVVWYRDVDQRAYEGSYVNGMREGRFVAWNTNGTKSWEGYFRNGLEEKKDITWNGNGTVGLIREFSHGKQNGKHINFYPNGQKLIEHNFIDNQLEGTSTAWHPNGVKSGEYHYKNNQPVGKWLFWNETGELERIIDYDKMQETSNKVSEGIVTNVPNLQH